MSLYVTHIVSVAFKDFDGDGASDIAIIVDQQTNKDPIRDLIFYRGTNYFNGYAPDDDLSMFFVAGDYRDIAHIQNAINDKASHGRKFK